MKTLIYSLISLSFVLTAACTSDFTVKNKAMVLSAEKLDNELVTRAHENFVDVEQQKVYADFLKKNSRMDLKTFEKQGDVEAKGEVIISTVPRSLDAELKKVSGKEWQSMAEKSIETKTYPITLKKKDQLWVLEGLPFPDAAPAEPAKKTL